MRYLKYIFIGIVFGIVFTKAEIISWFRIYEMFRFESFHMYGVIGSAVAISATITALIKKKHMKDIHGHEMKFIPKDRTWKRYILGGSIFGLGWAMTGACPGPMFIVVGTGNFSYLVIILAALLGTYTYGVFRDKLPH